MNEKRNSAVLPHTITRRQTVAGLAIGAFGGLFLPANTASAATEEQLSHSQESIHQETVFKASRKRVYEALTDTKQFDKIIQLSPEMQAGKSFGTSLRRSVANPAVHFPFLVATSLAAKSN